MSIADGRDYRNWLNNPEEHMAVKEARRMLKFKIRVFSTALRNEKYAYEKLLKGTEKRIAAFKPDYKSREELDAAYVVGAVSDQEYMRNRSAIWNVWSDRGHIANIEWLEQELAKYQKAMDELEQWMAEKHKEAERRRNKKQQQKKKHLAYKRRKYKQDKRKELEKRWKYYGID